MSPAPPMGVRRKIVNGYSTVACIQNFNCAFWMLPWASKYFPSHASGLPAHVPLPGVHRVASPAKRWLLGTHQGAVEGCRTK
jgi:hypothetical protein